MKNNMTLTVYSLKGIQFSGEIRSLNVNTKSGEITILNNHRPLISVLEKGIAKIGLLDNTRQELEISSGFLEMDDKNNLSILID